MVVWHVDAFYIAAWQGREMRRVVGYRSRYLGLHKSGKHGPHSLIHLNTGYRICHIFLENDIEAQKCADEISRIADWSFDTLTGWQNRYHDLFFRIEAILVRRGHMPRVTPTKLWVPTEADHAAASEAGAKNRERR